MLARLILLFLLLLSPLASGTDEAGILSPLISPTKIDSLSAERAANPRLRKIAYWLETARRNGQDLGQVIDQAQRGAGYAGTARARVEKAALIRNVTILERLGCLTDEGMTKLRKGNAPTITRGPYTGDVVEVDHVIPRAVVPELDSKLYNLEFMPGRMNREKSASVGQRQVALAMAWHKEGLLSAGGLQAVLKAQASANIQSPGSGHGAVHGGTTNGNDIFQIREPSYQVPGKHRLEPTAVGSR